MLIRKFQEIDLEQVATLWLKTNISAHDFIPKSYWESVYNQVKMALPQADLVVAEENGKIVGFIGVIEEGYIAGLFVEKAQQGKGIGKKLIASVQIIYPRLTLDVFVENKKAVAFYKKQGFQVQKAKLNPELKKEEYTMVLKK